MKFRTSIAVTTEAALVGAGAFVLPAAASAGPATHTLKFISVTKNTIAFSATTGAQMDIDVNSAGKMVGFDMLCFTANSKTTGTLNITVASPLAASSTARRRSTSSRWRSRTAR